MLSPVGLRAPVGAAHTECSYLLQRSPSGPCPPHQAHCRPTPPHQLRGILPPLIGHKIGHVLGVARPWEPRQVCTEVPREQCHVLGRGQEGPPCGQAILWGRPVAAGQAVFLAAPLLCVRGQGVNRDSSAQDLEAGRGAIASQIFLLRGHTLGSHM